MDEGWATTLELLIGQEDLGKETAESFFKQFRVNSWIYDAQAEEDVPIITLAMQCLALVWQQCLRQACFRLPRHERYAG